ncbi:hypothetical protein PG996_006502 [Apiospora saccharicola]|uniref:Amine oxidase domain-containing protein n=1 Tax=Apiospora saccharicola TaxID=335842 RepID=A0ABR1VPI4_9PEZI
MTREPPWLAKPETGELSVTTRPLGNKMKVAIVGTGMAGLATGYLLQHDELQRYSVTLFEKGDRISLDAASVTLMDERDGTCSRVDLPMRAFAGGFYSSLMAMYDHLGIRYHAKRFLFAFADVARHEERIDEEKSPSLLSAAAATTTSPYFIHSSNNHRLLPIRPPGADAIGHFLEVVFVLACYAWFTLCCFVVEPRARESYGTYLKRTRVPRRFVDRYLVPLMSSVATCSHEELLASPASDLTGYQRQGFGKDHFVVSHGVQDVVSALSEGQDIRLSSEVLRVEPCGSRVRLVWRTGRGDGDLVEEMFDRVVLAVDPGAVAKVFDPLRSTMSRIPTRIVESAVLRGADEFAKLRVTEHSYKQHDTAAFDAQVADTLLLRSRFTGTERGYTEALHTISCGALVATSIAGGGFDELKPLHRASFWRVLRTPESREVVNDVMINRPEKHGRYPILRRGEYAGWHNGDDGVWLAGGWCWDGMVLLEGCIVSAVRVAQDFGVRIPWESPS